MRANVVEIPHIKWESQRKLGLDKSLREAVRDHLRETWPVGTAKNAARAYDLTLDRAREAVAGRPSLSTIERIFKRGGPAVFLPILEEVWGQRLARYFIELRERHEQNGQRIAALGSGLLPLPDRRSFVRPDPGGSTGERRRSVGD